jgi:fumarate hydratase subunit beta
MSTTHRLKLPVTEADVRKLAVGDFVILGGDIVLTAGLPTHERIREHIAANKPLPIDVRGGALFHLGSYSRETNGKFEVLYMNPTTSTRFNGYMPQFIRHFGLRMVGGKGGLDAACTQAMKETDCVYLTFLGGGAALHTDAIREVIDVAWNDLVSHYRLVKLRVEGLGPLLVGIDAHGNSSFDQLSARAEERLPDILDGLGIARAESTKRNAAALLRAKRSNPTAEN